MTKIFLGAVATATVLGSACAQWAQITPTASPSGRFDAGSATAPNGDIVMFGGSAGISASNQTWRYDGTTWMPIVPTVMPPAKTGFELVWDSARGVFVAFGGMNTSPFGGASNGATWEFDGFNWTQAFPTATPGGLGAYGACFDSVRNKLVLYGGIANSMLPLDANGTWEYDGLTWTHVTPTGNPGPLERPAMCFHAGLGRTVMFGGIDVQIGGNDTTWLYDGAAWTAAPVTGPRPAARTGAKMAFDPIRAVCVLTGGMNPMTGQPIIDTWEFDGTAWTQVASVTTGRYASTLAFSTSRREMVQFGGSTSSGAALGDTWEYGAKVRSYGTGCAGSAGVPALNANDAPRLGQTLALGLTNLHPAINIGVIVLGVQQLLPGVPLDSIGMTGCLAFTSPDVLYTINGAAGSATWTWPAVAGPFGASFFAQGISLDPVNPAWLVASNALAMTLGN